MRGITNKRWKAKFRQTHHEFFYFSSLFMMIQKYNKPVIVLDAGKVLVDYDPTVVAKELSKRCGREVGLPQADDLYRLFFPVYVGTQSWRDVLQTINRALGFSLESQEWLELWCRIFTGEIAGMREVLAELKSEFCLVGLSNIDEVHWTFMLKKFPIFKLLDGWVVSYSEGVAKPDPAIYRVLMSRYCDGQLPVFYTDDNPRYVEAARRLDWEAEVFTDAAHFKEQIRKRRTDSLKSLL
jgi:FMN phosphatase YigB (HAD superfamily)